MDNSLPQAFMMDFYSKDIFYIFSFSFGVPNEIISCYIKPCLSSNRWSKKVAVKKASLDFEQSSRKVSTKVLVLSFSAIFKLYI